MAARRGRARAVWAVALSAWLAGCAKAPPAKNVEPVSEPQGQVRALVRSLYEVLETQEPERLNALLVPDVAAFGLGPKDSFTNRDTVVERLREELSAAQRGDRFKVVASKPTVGVSASAESAWFYDFVRVQRGRDGKAPQTWPARITGHAVKVEGAFKIDAVHVSLSYPDAQLYDAQSAAKLRAPQSPGDDRGPDSDQLVGLTRRLLDDLEVKVDRTSDRAEVVLIGTDPGDVYEGGKAFKDLARPRLAELRKAAFSLKIESGPRSRVSPDGKTGWVAATVVLRLGKGKSLQVLPAFRTLWVFAEENDVWNLVSEHQSLGLTPGQRFPAVAADLARAEQPAAASDAGPGPARR